MHCPEGISPERTACSEIPLGMYLLRDNIVMHQTGSVRNRCKMKDDSCQSQQCID